MTSAPWLGYAMGFVVASGLVLVLTPVARTLALRLDIVDQPGGYKQQERAVPYLGGVAIAVAAFTGVVVSEAVRGVPSWGQAVVVLGMCAVLVGVGFADDVRNLPPLPRLVVQALAALVVIMLGARVQLVDSALAETVLTTVWVVGITNGMNLLDNMDGLAAGVTAVSSGWLFVMAAGNGQYLVAGLLAAMIGASLGFLRHNFHPATIYMGDAGSLCIGFLLAVAAMRLRFNAPIEYTWLVPVLALGLPILDTSYVTVTRVARGKNPFSGGRDHISHRLVQVGFTVRGAVGILYGVAFIFGLLAFTISLVADWPAYLIAAGAFGVGVIAIALLDKRAGFAHLAGRGDTAGEETA